TRGVRAGTQTAAKLDWQYDHRLCPIGRPSDLGQAGEEPQGHVPRPHQRCGQPFVGDNGIPEVHSFDRSKRFLSITNIDGIGWRELSEIWFRQTIKPKRRVVSRQLNAVNLQRWQL